MSQSAHEAEKGEANSLIEVHYSGLTLDFGLASIPKLLGRFWVYLASHGQRLNDRQFALLAQVLILRDTQDFELRVSNLPMMSSALTLERDKTELRRMGLVFTERLYYPVASGSNPVMRAQRWDMRSLFYNLEQIARLWLDRQQALVATWERSGKPGNRPVYSFPPDYSHEVCLPREVAADIVSGKLFPAPIAWRQAAEALLATPEPPNEVRTRPETSGAAAAQAGGNARTGPETSGAVARTRPETSGAADKNNRTRPETSGAADKNNRTRPETSGAAGRTRPERSGHLLEDEEEEEEEIVPTIFETVFARFAAQQGIAGYQPSPKERHALEKLLAEGFALPDILAWIEAAFARPKPPRHFTFVAILAQDAYRRLGTRQPDPGEPETRPLQARQPEASAPEVSQEQPVTRTEPEPLSLEARTQPETQTAETRPEPETLLIDASLARSAEVCRSAGRELTPDLLARLRLMAARCEPAARAAGTTGDDWLAGALTSALGVARPANLLNYAEAVLDDWTRNGKPARQRPAPANPTPRQPRRNPGAAPLPKAYAGILDYLEQHGGIPHDPAENQPA